MLNLTNARVFDGLAMLPGRRTVTLDGNRVVAVSDDGKLAGAGERIDLGGMTVMPGMISCHLHSDNYKWGMSDFLAGDRLGKERPPGVLMACGVRTCRVLLESGFTGYVGAACSNDIDAQLKMAIAEDIIPGPRILACGHHIGTTADNNDSRKWWQRFEAPGTDLFADGPDAVRAMTRDEIRRGVEVIKIFVSSGHAIPGHHGKRNMSHREIAAIVEAAHERGAKVRAHVCHRDLILESVALGIDIIDHGDEVDEDCVDAMATAGSFWVPSLKFLQLAVDQGWPDPDGSTAYAHANLHRALPLAQKAGVRILLGDDYGGPPLPHEVGSYNQELGLYAGVPGIGPSDVLTWATKYAGELLVDAPAKVGVVEPGALADLIVIDGDPLADLSLLERPEQSVRAVFRDGVAVIDRLPPAARRQAAA
jgi:imidazolonepropionase-like amidohydrolase